MAPTDLIARKVLSKAGIYFILDGTTKPEKIRADTVGKLSRALGVSGEWIQYGRGPMELPAVPADNDDDYTDVTGYSQPLRGSPCRQARQHSPEAKFSPEVARQLQVKN